MQVTLNALKLAMNWFFFMTFCMISSEKIDNLLVRDNFSETSFVSISRHSVLNIKHSSGLDSK